MLDYFKEQIIRPLEEMIIDKSLIIEDIEYHFMSIVKDNKSTKLWVLVHNPNQGDTDHDIISPNPFMNPDAFSYRERELAKFGRNISKIHSFRNIHINKHPFLSHSTRGHQIINLGFEEGLFFQHFLEKGLIPNKFFNYNLNNLSYYEYILLEGTDVPNIKMGDTISIEVETCFNHSQHWIDKSFILSFDKDFEQEVHLELDDGSTCLCYFHALSLYDILSETSKPIPKEKLSHLSDDEISELQKQRIEAVENICPKGNKLLITNYEIQEGYQLNLSSKTTISAPTESRNSSTASVMILSPDVKIGPNGHANRSTHLATVPDDFEEDVEISIWTLLKNISPQTYESK